MLNCKSVARLMGASAFLLLPLLAAASDKEHCYLRDASAPTASSAFLLCEQGLVYATTDAGATWTARDTGAAVTLHAISFSDANHGFVAGEGGTLLATADGGKTWQVRNTGSTEHVLTIFTLGNRAWVGGFDGTILYSSDQGATWVKQKAGTTMALENIFFLDPDHGWAVGWSGTILRTADGGKNWETIKTDAASWSLAAVHFNDLKNGWAVGFAGQLLHSSDGGTTWVAQKSPTQSWLTSVATDHANRLWIAGDDQLLLSEDSGATWRGIPVANMFVSRVFPLGGSLRALGELGILKQGGGSGLEWKHDDSLVPAGAHIANSLEDAAKATTGKSQ
ncbi:MAG: WD40/YVTN/BNR-like repeat-containing protein [Terracidiphilus sp.]